MKHNKYLSEADDAFLYFQFTSEGPKGLVPKIVTYSKTEIENLYNLGFGDYNPLTESMDDLSVTNNGDSAKVLATVAETVYTFTKKYPKAWIGATGSTKARTRLYRMGITNNLHEISKDFAIFGYNCDGIWENFIIGKAYDAFLITRKENNYTL